MVAGVAGGIADRFEVDVTIVRVAFVVLTFFWGLGAVVYLAMWALVPLSRPEGESVEDADGSVDELPSGPPWLTYLLLAGALFLGVLFSSAWWGGPRWGGGLAFIWLLVLFVAVVVALRRPARRLSPGRVLLALALVAVSLVIVAVGAFFATVAATGVPFTGGIGDRVVQPTSISQLQPTYRLAAGTMTIDLTHVALGTTPRSITASVAVGRLLIEIPVTAVVTVNAHAGVGTVTYGPGGPTSFPAAPAAPVAPVVPLGATTTTASVQGRPQLVVNAQVGIGQVELQRGAP